MEKPKLIEVEVQGVYVLHLLKQESKGFNNHNDVHSIDQR